MNKKQLPPYASTGSFWLVLQRAAEQNAYTDAVYEGVGQSTREHIVHALRSLGLVGPQGATEVFQSYISGTDDDRQIILREFVRVAYPEILNAEGHLLIASEDGLENYFTELGANGTTRRKCYHFFLELAKRAGFTLNLNNAGESVETKEVETKQRTPKAETLANGGGHGDKTPSAEKEAWARKMLPAFNDKWPEKRQDAWFEAFNRLLGQ